MILTAHFVPVLTHKRVINVINVNSLEAKTCLKFKPFMTLKFYSSKALSWKWDMGVEPSLTGTAELCFQMWVFGRGANSCITSDSAAVGRHEVLLSVFTLFLE